MTTDKLWQMPQIENATVRPQVYNNIIPNRK